jgi:hypothetical protein
VIEITRTLFIVASKSGTAAIDEGVPAEVLSAALYARFRSRGEQPSRTIFYPLASMSFMLPRLRRSWLIMPYVFTRFPFASQISARFSLKPGNRRCHHCFVP